MTVSCPCGSEATLVTGKEIYPHRRDLHHKPIWRCGACEGYVGCHPGTTKPLGSPANQQTRAARMAAHEAFDPMWRDGAMKRRDAYKWLAEKLGRESVHIGFSDIETCQRIVALMEGRIKP